MKVLVFTRTRGYRHASIEPAVAALRSRGLPFDWTEDPHQFTSATLADYSGVVFLHTTGEVLEPPQQTALRGAVESGLGFAGVHAAADGGYTWPWYGDLLGARFWRHPRQQRARLLVQDASHPAAADLPSAWEVHDEWYDFKHLRDNFNTIIRLDTGSYQGHQMGDPHPIAWSHEHCGGRSFYTGLGHRRQLWRDPLFLSHVLNGICWAASLPSPPGGGAAPAASC